MVVVGLYVEAYTSVKPSFLHEIGSKTMQSDIASQPVFTSYKLLEIERLTYGWGEIGPWSARIEIAAQLLSHLLALAGLRPCGLSDVGNVTEPGRPVLECLRGCSTGRQRRLEALIELGQARVVALGHQRQTHTGHVVEPLVGLETRQAKGRSAFEREQVAGVAQECGDDRIGFGPRRGGRRARRRTLGLSCRWCWRWADRTRYQARHRQHTAWDRRGLGFLADQVAHLLAHGFAKVHFESRISLGQGLGQVAQIMGLTKLIATLR